MTDEQLVCPRRAGIPPNPAFPDHDKWETDRWNSPHYEAKWPEELGEHPRTCSFCGCVHPEDAIDLIKNRGWEIEPSTKCYKWYINPPGAMLHHKRIMASFEGKQPGAGDDAEIEAAFKAPHHVIVPPVKLYGMHGTPEQLATLNGLLDLQRRGKEGQ